jgi:ABC-type multidrug transport system fused ATPase/permease subunit
MSHASVKKLKVLLQAVRSPSAPSGISRGAISLVIISALSGIVMSASPALLGVAIDALLGHTVAARSGVAALADPVIRAGGAAGAVAVAGAATLLSVGLAMANMRIEKGVATRAGAAIRTAMLSAAIGSSAADRDTVQPATARGPGAPAGPAGAEAIRYAVTTSAPMLASTLVSAAAGLPQVVFGVIVVLYEFVQAGATTALVGGLALFLASRALTFRHVKSIQTAQDAVRAADTELGAQLGEKLAAAEDLRLTGARKVAIEEYMRATDASTRAHDRFAAALAASSAVRGVFASLSPLVVLLALRYLHNPAPGEIAELLLLVPILGARLERADAVREAVSQQASLLEAAERVLALPESPPRSADAARIELASVRGAVAFEDVAFTHRGAASPLLRGVSFEVPPGATVCICGKNGSGKSTLLRLLLRIVDPTGGGITLDGRDVRLLDPDQLPGLFAVLGQHSTMLRRSIGENLRLGLEPQPDTAALNRALAAVGLEGQLGANGARGLDYVYRPGATNLSGGEARRVLLARALLRNAPVLILDEPEAALPPGEAESVLHAVATAVAGRTCLIVTHSPHLVPSAFNVVIDDGRVLAKGSHAELLSGCAVYRELQATALQQTRTA